MWIYIVAIAISLGLFPLVWWFQPSKEEFERWEDWPET